MKRLASVCPDCGSVFERESDSAYCKDCKPEDDSWTQRDKTTDERGYGARWQRLSKKARKLQPFCSDCYSPDDLTADHTEQAWERYDAGKTIRLQDIDVVCLSCNSARGAARGDKVNSRRRIVDKELVERRKYFEGDHDLFLSDDW